MSEQSPKTIGKAEVDPRFGITVSITRTTKNHRGQKNKIGELTNDTMEFSTTVTLTSDPGAISQSDLYHEAATYLNEIYFDQMEISGQVMQAILEE
jgi:hypothetical protein